MYVRLSWYDSTIIIGSTLFFKKEAKHRKKAYRKAKKYKNKGFFFEQKYIIIGYVAVLKWSKLPYKRYPK